MALQLASISKGGIAERALPLEYRRGQLDLLPNPMGGDHARCTGGTPDGWGAKGPNLE